MDWWEQRFRWRFFIICIHKIVLYVAAEFNMLTSVMKFLPVNELFSTLLPVGMLLGVGIGFFGSVFTSQRHLKV